MTNAEIACIRKRLFGLSLVLVVISSIFAVIPPPTSAAGVSLQKQTYPDPNAEYSVGDTIDYLMKVTSYGEITVDVFDDYPNGTVELLQGGLHLNAGDSVTYSRSYVASEDDVVNGYVTNTLYVQGKDDFGDPISAQMTKSPSDRSAKPCPIT